LGMACWSRLENQKLFLDDTLKHFIKFFGFGVIY
jgi:hypothetical protein